MWSRHMYFPSRNVFAAGAPYTDPIDFEIATELASSALAIAPNVGAPLYPASVAFIARTACWPNCCPSRARRSDAVSVAFVPACMVIPWCIVIPCICMPAIGELDEEDELVPPNATTATTAARQAASRPETRTLRRMTETSEVEFERPPDSRAAAKRIIGTS